MKKADILWYNSSTGETQVWYMDGHRLVGRGTVVDEWGNFIPIGPPFSIVGVGDTNGDGKADIVWYNSQTGETQVWYMDGHRLVGRGTVVDEWGNFIPIGPPFSIVGVGDTNGDGKADIVWYNSQTGETQVWYMDGHRLVGRGTVVDENGQFIPIGPPFSIVGTGDFGIGEFNPKPSSLIKHVFVLMLENRSFDHMLGFSGITGTDAATGQPTSIDGLNGSESNSYNGVTYPVVRGAPDRAQIDPPHGFSGVLEQLCGEGAVYVSGQPYPPINNSGYVSVFARSHPELPDGAMRCFTPDQVPVTTALAQEFVVCDRWFSSMPGPTEPNRFFVHAGTSGFFDNAPSRREYAEAFSSPWSGIAFKQGTIFDRLGEAGVKWRIYGCDSFPNVALLKGVSRTFDIDDFDEDFASDVASDVASPSYDAAYTFIEPSYDAFSDFSDGNSQHPLGSVKAGELLIKKTYEALRKSPMGEDLF